MEDYQEIRKLDENSTFVPIKLARDKNISLGEKGMLLFLLSLPDGYILKKSEMCARGAFNNGGSQISQSTFNKLVKKGYVTSELLRGTATFKRYKYCVVYEGVVLREFYTNNNEYKIDKTPAFVYLYTNENTTNTKIGVTKNPKQRLVALNSAAGCRGTMFHIQETTTDMEAILHLKYKHKKVYGEWFDLSLDERLEIINTLNNGE